MIKRVPGVPELTCCTHPVHLADLIYMVPIKGSSRIGQPVPAPADYQS
jgi:hypothetical protein